MNEHIKQCILDAGFPKFDRMYVVSDGEELEKFADLIVQKCLYIVDNEGCGEGGSIRAMEKIKEHFGV